MRKILVSTLIIFTTATAVTKKVPSEYSTIQAGLNAASSGDTVLVAAGTYTENIMWPETNGIKLISAGDSSNTIIDGGGTSSVIYMNPSSATIDTTTLIQGFKITNGGNVNNGAGIFCSGSSPQFKSLMVSGNQADNLGGGIYVQYGSARLTKSLILSNTAFTGGGVTIYNSNAVLDDLLIENNNSSAGGGGLYIWAGDCSVSNSIVDNNSAGGSGGGIYLESSSNLINVRVANNSAGSGGGLAVWSPSGSSPSLGNLTIIGNTASNIGGGIYMYNANADIKNTLIYNNSANDGAGIHARTGGFTLTDVIISNNSASSNGGGLHLEATPQLNRLTISYNSADLTGGGVYIKGGYSTSSPVFENVTITGNSSNSGYDGIYTISGGAGCCIHPNVVISNSNFVDNGTGYYNNDNAVLQDATNNWWDNMLGPYHPSQNPTGQGDSTNAFVNVDPWLTAPNTDAPPIPAQSVAVSNKGNDFITLSWDASAMGDLSGYKVYYDTDGYPYSNSVDVSNVTSYTISGLSPSNNYYVAVTTYDTDGNESWYSKGLFVDISVPSVSISPANGSIEVPIGNSISVSFSEAVRKTDGTALDSDNVDALITLKDTDVNGTDIPFDATVNDDKTVITVNPSTDFTSEQVVYVAIGDGLEDYGDNAVSPVASTFTAEDIIPPSPFDLVYPFNDTTIVLTRTNFLDTLYFAWNQSVDTGGNAVTYKRELTGDLPSYIRFIVTSDKDSTTNMYKVPYHHIEHYMHEAGVELISGTWTIVATDGKYDVYAENGPFTLTIDGSQLNINESDLIPETFALYANYPNPFNPTTTITYDLPKRSQVTLGIYDLLGKQIKTLVKQLQDAGNKIAVWDGTNNSGRPVSAGVYLYQIQVGEFSQTRKMVLLR